MINTTKFYQDLGASVSGCLLKCRNCGAEQRPSADELSHYFRKGWPECCGQTMDLRRERQQEATP